VAKQVEMPSISFIVARSYPDHVIGCENKLPWHLRSDLRRFRQTTTGHVVIMGSKTYNSIGHPLPNRTSIVLTRDPPTNDGPIGVTDNFAWASSRESALFLADLFSIATGKADFFVIGGQEIYNLFFADDLINKVYLTEVFASVTGDAYFAHKFPKEKWKLTHEEEVPAGEHDEFPSRFMIYERRERRNRSRWLSAFYSDQLSKTEWLANYLKEHQPTINKYEQKHQFELL
jgi:dihydrofolate reductase